jgi:hypothetical protein
MSTRVRILSLSILGLLIFCGLWKWSAPEDRPPQGTGGGKRSIVATTPPGAPTTVFDRVKHQRESEFLADFIVKATYNDMPVTVRWKPSHGAVEFNEKSGRFSLNPEILKGLELTPQQLGQFGSLVSRFADTIVGQTKKTIKSAPSNLKTLDSYSIPGDLELARTIRTELLAKSIEIAGDKTGRIAALRLVSAANTDPILRGFGLQDEVIRFETLDSQKSIHRSYVLRFNGNVSYEVDGTYEGLGGFSKVFDLK